MFCKKMNHSLTASRQPLVCKMLNHHCSSYPGSNFATWYLTTSRILPEKYFCLFRFFLLLVPFFTAALVVCTTPFHRSLQCCFNQDTNWYHGGCLQCGTIVYIHKKPRETTYAVKYAFMMSGLSKFCNSF